MNEMDLLNKVRLRVEDMGCKSFRINVGKVQKMDGTWFDAGPSKGFSDLLVVRHDGKAVFIETKMHPRKPTIEQCKFLLAMINHNCPAGVAYSEEDAVRIVLWCNDFKEEMTNQIRGYLDGKVHKSNSRVRSDNK